MPGRSGCEPTAEVSGRAFVRPRGPKPVIGLTELASMQVRPATADAARAGIGPAAAGRQWTVGSLQF